MGAKGIANSEEDYIYGQLGIILRLCTAFIVLYSSLAVHVLVVHDPATARSH